MPVTPNAGRFRLSNRLSIVAFPTRWAGDRRPKALSLLREFLDEIPLDALTVRLAIRVAERGGRDLDLLPRPLFWKLYDLAADGDATARLIYSWLGSATGITAPQVQPLRILPIPCFRHGRLWLSPTALAQADATCERQLREIACDLEGV